MPIETRLIIQELMPDESGQEYWQRVEPIIVGQRSAARASTPECVAATFNALTGMDGVPRAHYEHRGLPKDLVMQGHGILHEGYWMGDYGQSWATAEEVLEHFTKCQWPNSTVEAEATEFEQWLRRMCAGTSPDKVRIVVGFVVTAGATA